LDEAHKNPPAAALAGARRHGPRRDEERRQREAIWAEHQAILDNPPLPCPRIRTL
jgi:hypothetical protein